MQTDGRGQTPAGYTTVQGIYCLVRNFWSIHPSAGYTPMLGIHRKIRYFNFKWGCNQSQLKCDTIHFLK